MNTQCPDCHGSGKISMFTSVSACRTCAGTGAVQVPLRAMEVRYATDAILDTDPPLCGDNIEEAIGGRHSFGSIPLGSVFHDAEAIYLKVEDKNCTWNAVNLKSFALHSFMPDDRVGLFGEAILDVGRSPLRRRIDELIASAKTARWARP